MKKSILHFHYSIGIFVFIMLSTSAFGQQKEYEKLKDLVEKDKLDKAEEYCHKVTAPMDSKSAARFYGLMGLAYYNRKNYPGSAKMLLKSEDKKTSAKVAKEFENKKNDFYDLKIAGRLYRIAQDYGKAAELLFQEGLYEESAQICPSPDANLNYGKQLFSQGKYNEALYFFKKAKVKGQKFSDNEVLKYYFDKKAYSIVYSIQNSGEGNYIREIQGCVIDKMFENNEPMTFIQHFLDSLGIKSNKQDEAIIGSLIQVRMFDQAEKYCLDLKQGSQQPGFAFMAEAAGDKYPQMSAWANLKSGKTLLGKQQLTVYLIETAIAYNSKWDKEPIEKKELENYNNETKAIVEKCEMNYCEFIGFAFSMAKSKSDELSTQNPAKAAEYLKSNAFLKQVETEYCKKK